MLDTNNSISSASYSVSASKVIEAEKLEYADDLAESQQIKILDELDAAQLLKGDRDAAYMQAVNRFLDELKQYEIRSQQNTDLLKQDTLMRNLQVYEQQDDSTQMVDTIA